MFYRIAFSFVFVLGLVGSASAQHVVRFETTAGDFDMVLNPTNNPLLDDYANNMLNYVDANHYLGSWINRADTGFVLQMGGFFSNTKRPPPTIDSVRSVAAFAPVLGAPAAITGLSNTVGTVSLALPGDGMGGTNQDAGTSSFFVNLTSNTFLDADFTVFAAISDMTTINNIMALQTIDRTTEPDFGAGAGNLGFAKVPLEDNGFQVFIKRAFVVSDSLAVAKALAGVSPIMAASASGGGSGEFSAPLISGGSSLTTVPEPASAALAFLCAIGAGLVAPRRRRA
jgi:cyclophilin family peptidyl-prolyl cis-trans isomerase